MRIAYQYNHLNAREYLLVNKNVQFTELQNSITTLDANNYLKISLDKAKFGIVIYSQGKINSAIQKYLRARGWAESKVYYYVTSDEPTTREIVHILDKDQQKQIIESRGHVSHSTYNQVDFQKDRIAVEVQFGKYFSVAYDLHVKHTFFYSRNDIDVGIEVIPTKAMEESMDTGVPWFENEVTNVIREGRTNPPVPILVLGIEPDAIASKEPTDYSDEELAVILKSMDAAKYDTQKNKLLRENLSPDKRAILERRICKIDHCLAMIRE
ncbi:MAG: restriction endonuclease [Clostridiales bacterium]|nr:restriction endonuclease [Clostridiales bacterium]